MRALPQRLSLVMIDCDGTMFDSFEANRGYYDAVLARLGRPALDERGQDLAHRLSTPQLFRALLGEEPGAFDAAMRTAREVDYEPFLRRMVPARGLEETLRFLRRHYRTALATNRGSTIPRLLEHFDLARYFDHVVGTHDVARPKPDPDMLLHCLERFATAPGEAVYVGDSPGDRAASEAAGVCFVAVGGQVDGDLAVAAFADLVRLLR